MNYQSILRLLAALSIIVMTQSFAEQDAFIADKNSLTSGVQFSFDLTLEDELDNEPQFYLSLAKQQISVNCLAIVAPSFDKFYLKDLFLDYTNQRAPPLV